MLGILRWRSQAISPNHDIAVIQKLGLRHPRYKEIPFTARITFSGQTYHGPKTTNQSSRRKFPRRLYPSKLQECVESGALIRSMLGA